MTQETNTKNQKDISNRLKEGSRVNVLSEIRHRLSDLFSKIKSRSKEITKHEADLLKAFENLREIREKSNTMKAVEFSKEQIEAISVVLGKDVCKKLTDTNSELVSAEKRVEFLKKTLSNLRTVQALEKRTIGQLVKILHAFNESDNRRLQKIAQRMEAVNLKGKLSSETRKQFDLDVKLLKRTAKKG